MALKEFTPEITEDLYKRMAARITRQGDTNVGLAHEEALARGLTGDPYEASLVGAARGSTAGQLADLDADLNFKVAGLGREERMRKEDWAHSDEQAALDRSFQERLAERGYDFQNTGMRRQQQAALWQLPIQGAFAAGGAYLGRRR